MMCHSRDFVLLYVLDIGLHNLCFNSHRSHMSCIACSYLRFYLIHKRQYHLRQSAHKNSHAVSFELCFMCVCTRGIQNKRRARISKTTQTRMVQQRGSDFGPVLEFRPVGWSSGQHLGEWHENCEEGLMGSVGGLLAEAGDNL